MEEQIETPVKFNFSKIFEYCILALTFFVPIIFIPTPSVSLYSSKIVFLATIIVAFIATFLAATLSTGRIVLPKSKFLIPVVLFPLIAIISSLFTGEISNSLAGLIFELGTSGSLVMLVLVFFMAMVSAKERPSLGIKVLKLFSISSIIVILHLLLRAFASPILPNAVASRIPDYLIGGPIDTSIFLSIFVIIAMTMLTSHTLTKKIRYALYALMVFSLLFIGSVGFTQAVVGVGLFSLIYFVYTFSWSISTSQGGSRSTAPSVVALIISVVFVLSGSSLSGYLANIFKVNTIEVRPNVEVTMNLIGEAWKKNPVVGIGPNMFKELWDMKRPSDINTTQFWSSEFNFGSGFIPTIAITTGLLGVAAILVFLFFYVRLGFKAIFSTVSDENSRFISATMFFASLFIWVMSLIYVPGISIMILAFIFTGVFTANLVNLNLAESVEVNIFKNPKANFASVFLIVVLLLSSIAGGYFVWERAIAASMYQKGDSLSALRLVSSDLYWRGVSESSLLKVNQIASGISSPENLSEADRLAIQSAISDSVSAANRAIEWNRKDFRNWFALGRVYEVLASNGIQGASDSAIAAYQEAEARAPQNPAIPLAYARLSAISGNMDGARENINKAISLKPNYTDAYFTLAQIEAASNNVGGAIRSVESATLVDPQNPALYFQLGLLKYNNGDYSGAAKSFEQSVTLANDYANARYFLGLTYYRLGKGADAIAQFEEIKKTNPENSEVTLILSNLKAGKSPFANAESPIDDKPEKRSELPIEEEE